MSTSTEEATKQAPVYTTPKPRVDKDKWPVLETDPADTGLKVTAGAWKWPPSWPYTDDYFDRENSDPDAEFYKDPRSQDSATLDEESRAALSKHLARFLGVGSEILEIGASWNSYLPEGLNLKRHMGVGMNQAEMDGNKALTHRIVQDLNAQPRLDLPDNTFDFVLITNTVEFFTDPRGVMREVWRVLKPQGLALVAFTGKNAYKDLEKKQVKMWKTMNDAQHMWIIGSYFKFSAGEGWEQLKGYDLSSEASKGMLAGISGKTSMYVVQASKTAPPDETDVLSQLRSRLWAASSMDTDDVEFCGLRLFAEYQEASSQEEVDKVFANADKLGQIFDILGELKGNVLYPPYKALLATRLAPHWTNSEVQKNALREGMGLLPAQDTFWKPLGAATNYLHPEDRVILLSDLVPLFDGTPDQQQALLETKAVLPELVLQIKVKQPAWGQGEVELLAADLLVTDFLSEGPEKRLGFLDWIDGVEAAQLQTWLDERKTYKPAPPSTESTEETTP